MNLAGRVAEAATSANNIIKNAARGHWPSSEEDRFEASIGLALALFKAVHQTGSLHGRPRPFSPAEIKLEADFLILVEDRKNPELSQFVRDAMGEFVSYERNLRGLRVQPEVRKIGMRRRRRRSKSGNEVVVRVVQGLAVCFVLLIGLYAAAHYGLMGPKVSTATFKFERNLEQEIVSGLQ